MTLRRLFSAQHMPDFIPESSASLLTLPLTKQWSFPVLISQIYSRVVSKSLKKVVYLNFLSER